MVGVRDVEVTDAARVEDGFTMPCDAQLIACQLLLASASGQLPTCQARELLRRSIFHCPTAMDGSPTGPRPLWLGDDALPLALV